MALTTTSGVTNSQTETYINGLPTSVVGFDGITHSTGYDALHRPSTHTEPRTGAATTTYKSGSRFVAIEKDAVTPTANDVATYTYDNAGRVIAVADALGKVTRFEYNKRDQMIRRWGNGAQPVEFAYNALGERIAMRTFRDSTANFADSTWPLTDSGIDPGADSDGSPNPASWTAGDKTTWAYDAGSGLLATKTDAASKAVTYDYNARGQVHIRTWARAVTTTYGYDDLTGELLTQTYDDDTPTVTYAYNRAGLPDTVTDATGTRTFHYNPTNPLQLDALDLGSYYNNRVLTRHYDGIKRPAGFNLGTTELQNAGIVLLAIKMIPDNPSARAMALRETRSIGANDKVIFGTGDQLGIQTITADAKFVRAAAEHGVIFIPTPYVHPAVPLTKQ